MIALGIVLLALGCAVIALPDSGDRLFSISETHGPSPVDAVGIAIALAGWALLLRVIWRGREAVRGSRGFPAGVILFAAGAAGLAVGVLLDLGWWWILGAVVMAGVQAAALGVATRAAKSP